MRWLQQAVSQTQEDTPTILEFTLNALYFVCIGIAVLAAVVFTTYMFCYLADKYFPGGTSSFSALHTNGPRHVLNGAVARDAGLTCMTVDERRLVLQHFLQCKSYSEAVSVKQINNDQTQQQIQGSTPLQHAVKCDNTIESSGSLKNPKEDTHLNLEHLVVESSGDDSLDHLKGCAICLNDYEPNDSVIVGTHCSHMFHNKCLLDWLDHHDICPFCRLDMLSAEEMKDSALKVFGEAHFREILGRDPIQHIRAANLTAAAAHDLESGPITESNTETQTTVTYGLEAPRSSTNNAIELEVSESTTSRA